MEPGAIGMLKPVLTALVLPPAGPLLLAALGFVLSRWRRIGGGVFAWSGLIALWLLSCHGMGIVLQSRLLPAVTPLPPSGLRPGQAEAVVVLGGGILPYAPEYGQAQLVGSTTARLQYGRWLARQSRLPLGFSGGVGWTAQGIQAPAEGEIARRWLAEHGGPVPRWVDEQSRDTHENARRMALLMKGNGIRRIALVTESWHMPRAALAFEQQGFEVVQAPTRLPAPRVRPILEWLPSSEGLALSRSVLREWLGLQVARRSG